MQVRRAFSQLRGVALGHCLWQNAPSSVSIWWGAKPRSCGFTQPCLYSFMCELNASLLSISLLAANNCSGCWLSWASLGLRRTQRNHTFKCDRTWKQKPTWAGSMPADRKCEALGFPLKSTKITCAPLLFQSPKESCRPLAKINVYAESQHSYWWTAGFPSGFVLSQRGRGELNSPKALCSNFLTPALYFPSGPVAKINLFSFK